MQVAPGRQDRRGAHQVAAGDRRDEAAVERAQQRRQSRGPRASRRSQRASSREGLARSSLASRASRTVAIAASSDHRGDALRPARSPVRLMRAFGERGQRVGALVGARRLADDMQAMRDQRVFEFEDRRRRAVAISSAARRAPGRLGLGEVDGRRLRLDQLGEAAFALRALRVASRDSARATP